MGCARSISGAFIHSPPTHNAFREGKVGLFRPSVAQFENRSGYFEC